MTRKMQRQLFALMGGVSVVIAATAIAIQAHAEVAAVAPAAAEGATSALAWASSIVNDMAEAGGVAVAAWFANHVKNQWLRSMVSAALPRAASLVLSLMDDSADKLTSALMTRTGALAQGVSYMNTHFQPALKVLGISPAMVESMVQAEVALLLQSKPAAAVSTAASSMADHINAITDAASTAATTAAKQAVGEAVTGALSMVANSQNVGNALAGLIAGTQAPKTAL